MRQHLSRGPFDSVRYHFAVALVDVAIGLGHRGLYAPLPIANNVIK